MLIAYRSTPHPATVVAPYEALRGPAVRTKLDYVQPEPQTTEKDDIIDCRDAEYKQRMKQQREGRKTRENNLLLGDCVSQAANEKQVEHTIQTSILCRVQQPGFPINGQTCHRWTNSLQRCLPIQASKCND